MIYLLDNFGIHHRDLKPKNVLFTTKDIVKIADLGEAKGNVMN